ncbi:unnamed protein product [Bursaphelenchus okinawaensis]|uniref:Uncharacterized protein n=1 Tax=Bursaphelenchus okinawaensis TaxID=465554 RepID=A0A811KG26_9BILA|nr:unnamed protein product [Bursaphelenchus okinawaensis]CAG9103770.1 unnamed protein product [Bursaphelenchus okinawaensis]
MPETTNLVAKCFDWLKRRGDKQKEKRLQVNEDIPDVLCNEQQLALRKRKKGYTRPNVQKRYEKEWTQEEQRTIQQLTLLLETPRRSYHRDPAATHSVEVKPVVQKKEKNGNTHSSHQPEVVPKKINKNTVIITKNRKNNKKNDKNKRKT